MSVPFGFSNPCNRIVGSIQLIQQALEPVHKDSYNPFTKSRYAQLPTIWEAAKPLLGQEGIAVLHPVSYNEKGGWVVRTILFHAASGEWVETEVPLVTVSENNPQAVGSSVTYAKRYGLCALLSIQVEEEDDDGSEGAGQAKGGKKKPEKANPKNPDEDPLVEAAREAFPGAKEEVRKPGEGPKISRAQQNLVRKRLSLGAITSSEAQDEEMVRLVGKKIADIQRSELDEVLAKIGGK